MDRLRASVSIGDYAQQLANLGEDFNGEDFCLYDPNDPSETGIVFEGATKLPTNNQDSLWEFLQRWCRLLSEIRLTVDGAEWHVHVDDHEIIWNEGLQEFDPRN